MKNKMVLVGFIVLQTAILEQSFATHMSKLPRELHVDILKKLDESTLRNAALVSHEFHEAVGDARYENFRKGRETLRQTVHRAAKEDRVEILQHAAKKHPADLNHLAVSEELILHAREQFGKHVPESEYPGLLGMTPLGVAAMSGSVRSTRYLSKQLSPGDLNRGSRGYGTPLTGALNFRQAKTAKILVDALPKEHLEAELDHAWEKTTALSVSLRTGNHEIAKAIADKVSAAHLVKQDSEGNTSLHLVAGRQDADLAQHFVSKVDSSALFIKNTAGRTPIDIARETGHAGVRSAFESKVSAP